MVQDVAHDCRLLVTEDRNRIDLYFKDFKCAGVKLLANVQIAQMNISLSHLLSLIICHNTKRLHPSDLDLLFSHSLSNNTNAYTHIYTYINT